MSDTLDLAAHDDVEQFDLTCPGCDTDLLADLTYNDWRVCGVCGRHFWVSARERAAMIARECDFTELPYREPVADALEQHQRLSPADRQDDVRERSGLADAVITAHVSLGGGSVIAALLDAMLLPAGIGIVSADKLISAVRTAIQERLPLVIVCSGGSQAGPAGILHGAQSLRLSSAIADLHRAGLPLIAVLTHPTGGNLLSGIVVNSDIRLAEPGSGGASDLPPDEIIARPELITHIAAVLDYLRKRGGPDVVLAGSRAGASARLATFGHRPAVAISIESGAWQGNLEWTLVRRAQRAAANLRLPIVFSISGLAVLSLETQAEIRDLLLRHREPVLGIVHGSLAPAHINILAVDTLIAVDDLAVPGSKQKRFNAHEARSTGLVDVNSGSDLALPVARAIEEALRLSPGRRMNRRLRMAERRGTEAGESTDLARLELHDLKDLQASVMRSVEDLRHRFEQREFTMPTLANLQSLPAFKNLSMPKLQMSKPDFIEMRDRLIARRKSGQFGEGDSPK
jgi:acetyl-CoA carboxylase beta subunit